MIVRPENMNFKDQNFAMILYGQPGIGKSTEHGRSSHCRVDFVFLTRTEIL